MKNTDIAKALNFHLKENFAKVKQEEADMYDLDYVYDVEAEFYPYYDENNINNDDKGVYVVVEGEKIYINDIKSSVYCSMDYYTLVKKCIN